MRHRRQSTYSKIEQFPFTRIFKHRMGPILPFHLRLISLIKKSVYISVRMGMRIKKHVHCLSLT